MERVFSGSCRVAAAFQLPDSIQGFEGEDACEAILPHPRGASCG